MLQVKLKHTTKSLKTKEKQRTFKRISYKERVTIENRHCMDKKTISDAVKELDRPPSAVSREIGGKPHVYAQIYGEGNGTVKKDAKT